MFEEQPVFWASLYHKDDIEKTPSRINFSLEEELKIRCYCVIYICKVGKIIKFPYQAVATAAVYLHHYLMQFPYSDKEKYNICNACLFLSSKTEECRKPIKELIRAQFVFRGTEPPARHSEAYSELHNAIVKAESRLLQAIDFCFHVNHPYQFLMSALKIVFNAQSSGSGAETNAKQNLAKTGLTEELSKTKKLARIAWCFVNDSFKAPVCLFYPPQHIALAAVELSVRFYNCQSDASTSKKHEKCYFPDNWWTPKLKQFDTELSKGLLNSICTQILKVFDNTAHKSIKAPALSTRSSVLQDNHVPAPSEPAPSLQPKTAPYDVERKDAQPRSHPIKKVCLRPPQERDSAVVKSEKAFHLRFARQHALNLAGSRAEHKPHSRHVKVAEEIARFPSRPGDALSAGYYADVDGSSHARRFDGGGYSYRSERSQFLSAYIPPRTEYIRAQTAEERRPPAFPSRYYSMRPPSHDGRAMPIHCLQPFHYVPGRFRTTEQKAHLNAAHSLMAAGPLAMSFAANSGGIRGQPASLGGRVVLWPQRSRLHEEESRSTAATLFSPEEQGEIRCQSETN